jgi:hypothetical protein
MARVDINFNGWPVHIGIDSGQKITWDVCYLSFAVNDALKLDFYTRTGYVVRMNAKTSPYHEPVFSICPVNPRPIGLGYKGN